MAKAKRLKITDLTVQEVKRAADVTLADIAFTSKRIAALEAEAEQSVQVIMSNYAEMIEPLRAQLSGDIAWLKDTMKSNKAVLFDGTDIVHLPHGSLIRELADKVSIPRDALAKCEVLSFDEVIKITKSIDRDAVEKWPDERLLLIGAERKPKEEFSYDLAKVNP